MGVVFVFYLNLTLQMSRANGKLPKKHQHRVKCVPLGFREPNNRQNQLKTCMSYYKLVTIVVCC